MTRRRLAAVSLVLSLGAALVLSGCGADKPPAEGSSQTGEVDPALTPQAGEEDSSEIPPTGTEDSNEDSAEGSNNEQLSGVAAIQAEFALSQTIESVDGRQIVTNPDSIYVVVNKERYLPEGYEPSDLVEPQVKFSFDEPHEKRQMRKVAAEALEKLFAQAENEGITLHAVSGYRSEKRQASLYNNYVATQGEDYANRVSAKPGTSEHQTGLTIDVSSPSVQNQLEEVFGDSEEGKWLADNAHRFGFIIRYPQDREPITGYVYEPWHIRYVGEEVAAAIYEQDTTLEQFFES